MKHTSLLHSYTSLLSQYMAVSYGDALFSCFLLLPLQQRFAPQLRKVVWGDHTSTLRLLTLPVTQVGVYSLTASSRVHLPYLYPPPPSDHLICTIPYTDFLTLTDKLFKSRERVHSAWLLTVHVCGFVCYFVSLRCH